MTDLVTTRPLAQLREQRTSIKWRRFDEDVLPLFVAEMDFELAPSVVAEVGRALADGDTGYLEAPGPLAPAFDAFARRSWDWQVAAERMHLATDVTVGMLEALRLVLPPEGGRVVLTPPVYPPFFEMVGEAHAQVVEVPLDADRGFTLDLELLEREFRGGVDAMFLCNPHNPTGRCHTEQELAAVAALAARHDVVVLSDEVHAPLTHPGARFVPFAPIAEAAGVRSVTVTSASKAWNLAGLKCAWIVAADERMARVLDGLPEEAAARTSILGLRASIAALADTAWRDAVLERITGNLDLLEAELRRLVPAARMIRPEAGYLVWLDLRATGLGSDPAAVLREVGRVAFNSGPAFGTGGEGFVRVNVACHPDTVAEAVKRIAATVEAAHDA